MKITLLLAGLSLLLIAACEENDKPQNRNDHGLQRPACERAAHGRASLQYPQVMVDDWQAPVKLLAPVNTDCLEDAVEISADGQRLYFMYAEELLDELGGRMLRFPNGTYVAYRTGGPGEFSWPVFYELGRGTDLSLDGSPSFNQNETLVYFHSNRAANTGYQQGIDDFLDMYVAEIDNGVPGVAVNLGSPVNSVHPDGEAALHPDDGTLFLTSLRPGPGFFGGGVGRGNLWRATLGDEGWSEPEMLDTTHINRPFSEQKQPAFTADGKTMYFVSDHLPERAAIYRSNIDEDGNFGQPELVIRGIVGEPSLTADGQYLYFVHVLMDDNGGFASDIWYTKKSD